MNGLDTLAVILVFLLVAAALFAAANRRMGPDKDLEAPWFPETLWRRP